MATILVGLVSQAAVAGANTVQGFDTPAGGTAYAHTDPQLVAPPEFSDFAPACDNAGSQRLVEGGRGFLRLAHDGRVAPGNPNANCNTVTFNCVEPATPGRVTIELDFRVGNDPANFDPAVAGGGAPADGWSISLLRVASDLAPGIPIEVDEVVGPNLAEAPTFPGTLGVGFQVSGVERVQVFWNGAIAGGIPIPVGRSMVNAGWIHAAIDVDFVAARVSLRLTLPDGSELVRLDALAVPGLAPYASRVHVAASSRALTASFDIDELSVVFPPRDPAQIGSWSPAFPLASVAIHAALLPGGDLLYWDRHDTGDGMPYRWNGLTSEETNEPTPPDSDEMYDLFCAGHAWGADGSLVVAGGHVADLFGEPWVSRYDPDAGWSSMPAMRAGRWYPSTATLPNGDIAVLAGAINPFSGMNEIPEVYDARRDAWRALNGAERSLPFYPFLFTTPQGLFAAGPMPDTGFLDVTGPGRWLPVDNTVAIARDYGSAVLTDPVRGRILAIGGTQYPNNVADTLRSTEWIDLSRTGGGEPLWHAGPPMTFARRMHTATLLPDGAVLVTGGTAGDAFSRADGAILNAELLDGREDAWQPMACAAEARVYHSVAILMPDARVLVAGGGLPGDISHATAELFSPPYLHRGGPPQLGAPVIAPGPGVDVGADGIARVSYGATIAFTVSEPSRVASVVWVRPAAVTHAFNQDQRVVPLAGGPGGVGVGVVAPDDPAVAPPGPYMMFVVDTNGVPSHAAWVRTNLPPEVADDVIEIVEDQPVPGLFARLTDNDVDVERDPTLVTIVDPPTHGRIVDDVYLPDADVAGDDAFTYTLSDGLEISPPATVTIRIAAVDDPPRAHDDTVEVAAGATVAIDVLANDGDVDDTNLTVVGEPHPRVTWVGGVATYDTADLEGELDRFRYTLLDPHGGQDTATVVVIVRRPDDVGCCSTGARGAPPPGALGLAIALAWWLTRRRRR